MLSGHHYWNFEAYQETQDLVGHHAQFGASKFVATDGQLIPNGKLTDVSGTPLDFRKAKSIGSSINATAAGEYCGTGAFQSTSSFLFWLNVSSKGCVGFDNCWLFDKNDFKKPVFSIWSVNSGIKYLRFLFLEKLLCAYIIIPGWTSSPTNQLSRFVPSFTVPCTLTHLTNKNEQIYSCNGIFDPALPIPRKKTQGGPQTTYADHSCVVIESESVIDAINNPEFGVDQIFGPKRPYNWEASYIFSTLN